MSRPILFHLFFFFLLIRSISFHFQSHISYGIPGVQASWSTTVLVFHLSFLWRGRAKDASLKKKKDNYSMEEKETGT